MLTYGPFYQTNPVPFFGGSSRAPQAARSEAQRNGVRLAGGRPNQRSLREPSRSGGSGQNEPCDSIAKIGRAPRQTGRNRCPVGSPRRTRALPSERQYRDRRR